MKYQQPNGWIRIEKQFNIRDGCNCVRKLIVDYDKWSKSLSIIHFTELYQQLIS